MNWADSEIDGDHIIAVLPEQVPSYYTSHSLMERMVQQRFLKKGEHPITNAVSKLKILEIKQLENDVIWLNYRVKNEQGI